MAILNSGRVPAGAWTRRIVFCCFGVFSTTLVLVALLAAALIGSGVLEW